VPSLPIPAPSAPAPADLDLDRAPGGWREGPAGGQVPVHDRVPCLACEPRWFRPVAPDGRPEVTSPEHAATLLVPRLAGADRERCVAALLDTKHRLLEVVTVSVGSLDHTFMAPREILRDALAANAAAVVVAHNHPSGDPEPSRDDEQVTRRLVRAGELVGIGVLDHLVVGGERWVSLARRGVA
jgi:DNA repair protein RadC